MLTVAMSNDTSAFYDAIAEYYPRFYRDWEIQLEREGLGLRAVFRGKAVSRVLDAACGAGTQAIPLASLGYEVVAVDPSEGMLQKARRTADERGVSVDFRHGEFVTLPDVVEGEFDAVVCKGNSLPHLLTDDEIEHTLHTFYDFLRPGGILVLGLRDFEAFMQHRPHFLPGFVHESDDGYEFITYERWEWESGPPVLATQHLYITQGYPHALETIKRSVTFRPLTTDEVQVVLLEAGFVDITQSSDRWEQVVVARKPE